MRIAVFMVVFICFSFMGCATIMHGTTQKIDVLSEPPDAKIIVDGKLCGNTPNTVKLERKFPHTVCLEYEGYVPYEVQVRRNVSDLVYGNLILPINFITIGIDVALGGFWYLEPGRINVGLTKSVPGAGIEQELMTIDQLYESNNHPKLNEQLQTTPGQD